MITTRKEGRHGPSEVSGRLVLRPTRNVAPSESWVDSMMKSLRLSLGMRSQAEFELAAPPNIELKLLKSTQSAVATINPKLPSRSVPSTQTAPPFSANEA